jgi:hypothetical protein
MMKRAAVKSRVHEDARQRRAFGAGPSAPGLPRRTRACPYTVERAEQVMSKRASTYESEALSVLAYEFSFSDKAETDKKIKGRFRRKKLGAFDAGRIALLRLLKDDLQEEIGKYAKSPYFTEPHGEYADMRDFEVPRLITDMSERYPKIPRIEIESFVPFCVLLYYLR